MRYDIENIMDEFPPLTATEERKLIEAHKDDRDRLNELLVLHNVALVLKIVNKDIHGFEAYRDDLVSAGIESLNKAARMFNPTKGIKFASYACTCARRGILRFIEQNLAKYAKHSNYRLDQRIAFRSEDSHKCDSTVESLVYGLIDPCWRRIPNTGSVVESHDLEELGKRIVCEIGRMEGISKRDKKVLVDYLYSQSGKKRMTFKRLGKKYGFSTEWAHQVIVNNIPKIRRMIKRKFDIFNLSQIYGG